MGICERFWDYLYNTQSFVGYMDNNPLMYACTTAKVNTAEHRWVVELADCHFTICYCPGKNNDANGLSRMPLCIEDYMDSCTSEISGETVSALVENVKVEKRDPCQGVGVVETCAVSLIRDCNITTVLASPLPNHRYARLRKRMKYCCKSSGARAANTEHVELRSEQSSQQSLHC